MRTDLAHLMSEIQRQQASKIDFVSDIRDFRFTASLELTPTTPGSQVSEFIGASMPVRPFALEQLGQRLPVPIPSLFLRSLSAAIPRGAASLLNNEILSWRPRATDDPGDGDPRMLVRCLDSHARAFLSARYRVMDHVDTCMLALEEAKRVDAVPIECSLTDTKMRLKLVRTDVAETIPGIVRHGGPSESSYKRLDRSTVARLQSDQKAGVFMPGVTISNSETGDGGLNVGFFIFDPVCLNGLVIERALRAVHIGGKLELGRLSAETIEADSRATMLKARDLIRSAFAPDFFSTLTSSLRASISIPILAPTTAVQNIVDANALTDADRDAILAHFLRDYDSTQFGLASAVSRHAQDLDDADKSHLLESLAGSLLAPTPA